MSVFAVTPTSLRLGDRGSRVKVLQSALNSAGYAFRTTGVFCRATESRLKAWQEKVERPKTGVCDAATWALLVE